MIKAIFFDMGGVLMDLHINRCIEAYRDIAGFKDVSDYLDPCHQRGFMKDLERGDIGFDGYIQECKRHCAPLTSTETILYCHRQFFSAPSQDTVRLVHDLSKRFELSVLSNNNAISMSILFPLFQGAGLPFETSFKHLFFSYEMHLLKPDAEIFRAAIARSGFKPEEILFIDDSPSNVQGGNSAGMKSVLYTPGTPLKSLIDKHI